MLKFRVPKIVIFCLLLMLLIPAMSALANQVKMVTFSNRSSVAISASHEVKFTIGQTIIGRTSQGTTSHSVNFGIWEMLSQSYLSSVPDEIPPISNRLFNNYPNPFNPSTTIGFTLAEEVEVQIELYDLLGRKVDTLLWEIRPAGSHSITYQPKNLASGVYLMLMRAGSFRSSQRITLVK